MQLRTLGELGERKVIDIIMGHLTSMQDLPIPFWDDVSAIRIGQGKAAILKTDMLVWATDVPKGMTPQQAARKAVVMNFSDRGSKGVQPSAFMVSLGLPRSLEVKFVEELAKGLEAGAREYDAYVLGGDTGETDGIIISGMAFGVAEEAKLMRRDGARAGDVLATTGPFGRTAAAFKILLEGYKTPKKLRDALVKSVFMPRARVQEGIALAESGSISASMDSSDGLAMSLHDLSRSSGVGFKVDTPPASEEAADFARLLHLDLNELVFYGGEEYELVFTVKPGMLNIARNALQSVGCDLIEIGKATSDIKIVYNANGEEIHLRSGYEHFKS